MEPFHINAALAGLGYALAASFSKCALARGAGILRFSFVANLLFVPVFALILLGAEWRVPWAQIGYPVLTGLFFFLGQIFTFAAIRMGDVSLQTPVMGTKAVFVVLIAVLLGTEVITLPMACAAVVAMLGVALLGFSGGGAKHVGLTLILALLSSLFFAGSDTMMGVYGRDFGAPSFLFFAMLVNALLSFAMIPFFEKPLRAVPRQAWLWMLAGGLLMAGQALLMGYTLTRYQQVAATNIIYSTRGLCSVVIGLLLIRMAGQAPVTGHTRIQVLRGVGAVLMCAAVAILFLPS